MKSKIPGFKFSVELESPDGFVKSPVKTGRELGREVGNVLAEYLKDHNQKVSRQYRKNKLTTLKRN